MKPDEAAFLKELAASRPRPTREAPFATDIGVRLGLHPKRAHYLLEKWLDKGWWECGVSVRSGWLTGEGLARAAEVGATYGDTR